ncbi:MAG: hypothetical protein JRJ54_15430 [Deltaproteobacteria bacterium]|nr:hypothetical protein [Deltaproteobacteria bacterium]
MHDYIAKQNTPGSHPTGSCRTTQCKHQLPQKPGIKPGPDLHLEMIMNDQTQGIATRIDQLKRNKENARFLPAKPLLPIGQLMGFEIMPQAIRVLGQPRLPPAFDVLLPKRPLLLEFLGSGCLFYDVASLIFGNIMPRPHQPVKMGLN